MDSELWTFARSKLYTPKKGWTLHAIGLQQDLYGVSLIRIDSEQWLENASTPTRRIVEEKIQILQQEFLLLGMNFSFENLLVLTDKSDILNKENIVVFYIFHDDGAAFNIFGDGKWRYKTFWDLYYKYNPYARLIVRLVFFYLVALGVFYLVDPKESWNLIAKVESRLILLPLILVPIPLVMMFEMFRRGILFLAKENLSILDIINRLRGKT